MVTRISTMAAAAALMLASPAAAQVQAFTDFRGGGHISNFVNCPDWSGSISVTARARVFEEDQSLNIFTPSFAIGWRDFNRNDDDNGDDDDDTYEGWFTVQQTGIFSGSFTSDAQLRVLNVTPDDFDFLEVEDFNIRFWVVGFPSMNSECRADIRLNLRAHH